MSTEKGLVKEELLGKKLGKILVALDRLTPEALKKALEAQESTESRLGEFLLKRNIITEDDLLLALSYQLNIEYRPELIMNAQAVFSASLSRAFIKQYNVLIVGEDEHTVELAINDPFQFEVIERVSTYTGKNVRPVLAKKLDILRLADVMAGESSERADQVIEDLEEANDYITVLDSGSKIDEDMLDMANEAPIIRLVNLMITEALKERASDIHVEPSEEGITVRYRIDGVLYNVLSPPKRYQQAIISRIKIMADLNIAENRLPQDGRIRIKYGANNVDIRVSIVPSVVGERVVLRLLVKDEQRFNLDRLGMQSEILREVRDLLKIPHGIIVVSGPTGSGKTTTLYAAIREINSPEKNIITIEDPVEYRIKGVNQIQINPKIQLTFANGLRSILRQDPEVIMVGEIRDRETAEIAIQAAMTGHLVLSTVHTNDAASGIVRLIDMGIEPYLIASTVTGFLSQRLVRVLCTHCKRETDIDPQVLVSEGFDPHQFEGKHIYQAVGCTQCQNTGYHGRIGIFEIIRVDDEIRRMIVERKDASVIRESCISRGMSTMLDDGLQKVLDGTTSFEEVMRVIRE